MNELHILIYLASKGVCVAQTLKPQHMGRDERASLIKFFRLEIKSFVVYLLLTSGDSLVPASLPSV